jgi:Family of unknown function (DUF6441)
VSGELINISIDGSPGGADLAAAFQGRLQRVTDARLGVLKKAATSAMNGVVKHAVTDLRADIAGGGFQRQTLTKTWHAQKQPGGQDALDPAAFIWNKAGPIIDAFANGITIHVNGAQFLAIPEGPAKGIIKSLNVASLRSREGGQFAKEDNPVARVAAALGVELVAKIDQARGEGVLVAANPVRLTPKTGKLAKRQDGSNTVLFVLVKQATLRKRIQGRALLEQIKGRFAGEYGAAFAAAIPDEA